MNPFLETPLAVHQPGARWRAAVRGGANVATPARPRGAQVLRAMMLAGALVAPFGAGAAVDLNAATPEQLQEVKGIGPKMARVIVEERDRGGRYASITDLAERVKGIGPKKAAVLQASGLTVGAADARPADSRAAAPPARRGR